MTDEQHRIIQALAKCRLREGSFAKGLITTLSAYQRDAELSQRQAETLIEVAWQYRGQLRAQGVHATKPPSVEADERAKLEAERAKLEAWNKGRPL